MALGTAQDVLVTVSAAGGESGSLTLGFAEPAVLSVSPTDPPVLLAGDTSDGASADFTLAPGLERAFRVTVHAVGVGDAELAAVVSGLDDLGRPVAADAAARITVADGIPGGIDTDTVTETTDVRGKWLWTYRTRFNGKVLVATYTMTITKQDPETGAVTGRMVVDSDDPYPTYRGKVKGRVVGDQVDLKVTGSGPTDGPIVGTLGRRDGKLAIRQAQGIDGVTFVLVDPRAP